MTLCHENKWIVQGLRSYIEIYRCIPFAEGEKCSYGAGMEASPFYLRQPI